MSSFFGLSSRPRSSSDFTTFRDQSETLRTEWNNVSYNPRTAERKSRHLARVLSNSALAARNGVSRLYPGLTQSSDRVSVTRERLYQQVPKLNRVLWGDVTPAQRWTVTQSKNRSKFMSRAVKSRVQHEGPTSMVFPNNNFVKRSSTLNTRFANYNRADVLRSLRETEERIAYLSKKVKVAQNNVSRQNAARNARVKSVHWEGGATPSRSTGTTTDGGSFRRNWTDGFVPGGSLRSAPAVHAGQTGFVRSGHHVSDRVWAYVDARSDGSYTLSVSSDPRFRSGH